MYLPVLSQAAALIAKQVLIAIVDLAAHPSHHLASIPSRLGVLEIRVSDRVGSAVDFVGSQMDIVVVFAQWDLAQVMMCTNSPCSGARCRIVDSDLETMLVLHHPHHAHQASIPSVISMFLSFVASVSVAAVSAARP